MPLAMDQEHMLLAIQEARRSRGEDERIHPNVGAVVVRDGSVVGSACRGDQGLGDHAEYSVLEKKLHKEKLAGCTVYTTLEPCTTRNHPKLSCAERLIERRVTRVVIGMLDPDQRITGQGVLKLRQARIAVDLFPQELMSELEELNRDFTRDREKLSASSRVKGIAEAGITVFYPSRNYYERFREAGPGIDNYVSTAKHSVVMVSINLMTGIPFHDLCVALERKVNARGSKFEVKISLLDPTRTDLMTAVAPVLSRSPDALAHTIQESLRALASFRDGLSVRGRARVEIRLHQTLPSGSAILLDHQLPNGRIQIETKPYKSGVQKSFAFEVKRTEPDGLYDVLAKSYEDLFKDARVFSGYPE